MHKLGRRYARPAFKETLEMMLAQMHTGGDLFQTWLLLKILLQVLDGGFNTLVVLGIFSKDLLHIQIIPAQAKRYHPNLAKLFGRKLRVQFCDVENERCVKASSMTGSQELNWCEKSVSSRVTTPITPRLYSEGNYVHLQDNLPNTRMLDKYVNAKELKEPFEY